MRMMLVGLLIAIAAVWSIVSGAFTGVLYLGLSVIAVFVGAFLMAFGAIKRLTRLLQSFEAQQPAPYDH